MSTSQLQADLLSDIETLKHLKLGILPAKKYYQAIFKGFVFVYLSFVCTLLLACFFANSINAWPYTKDYPKKVRQIQQDGYESGIFSGFYKSEAIQKEIQKPYEQKISELRGREEFDHQSLVINMYLGVFSTPLLFTLFLMGHIQTYVIYVNQLSQHLKTGKYMKRKIWHAYIFFMGCFALISLFTVSISDQDYAVVAAFFSAFFSVFGSTFLIDMEISRIGISPLTSAISDYFGRDETPVENRH